MPLPPDRRASNITRTILSYIGQSLEVETFGPQGDPLSLTVAIHHDWPWADPEAASQLNAAERQWVTSTWLDQRAGRGAPSLLQVDVWTRLGQRDDDDADPVGAIADDIADEVEAIFAGQSAPGFERGVFPVLDFGADPESPTETDARIRCMTAEGRPGQPQERRKEREGGIWRVTLRFRFFHSVDLASQVTLYE